MKRSFTEYLMLREGNGEKKAPTEVKLEKDSDFKPFNVDAEHNSNLRPLIKAFLDSDKVALPGPEGYPQKLTTIEKDGGEVTPKLKKKGLYLVGGAVRDHLRGKTPKDFDLATDATPDEIRLILRSAGFTETKPQTGRHAPVDKKYHKHPEPGAKNRIFYAKGWDKAGREFVIGARVNGQEFEIATFRKDSKSSDGRHPERMEFAGLDDDAQRRDFTINSMYIPLTSADGTNNKLIDPHGGAHHVRNGEVKFIGDAKDRLEEDQLRALRYIRFAARHDNKGDVPEEYQAAIGDVKDLPAVSRERIRDEFLKGLEHPDVDPVRYIKMYQQLGLLPSVFPGMTFKLDVPKDFSDKKEKRLAIAWLLKDNDPEDVKNMLSHSKWTNDEINDIVHLIKVRNWGSRFDKDREGFFGDFYNMKKNLHHKTGLVPSMINKWGQMTGLNPEMLDHYNKHELSTKAMIPDKKFPGRRMVNPEISSLVGRTPQGEEFGHAIRHLETEKFRDRFNKNEMREDEF